MFGRVNIQTEIQGAVIVVWGSNVGAMRIFNNRPDSDSSGENGAEHVIFRGLSPYSVIFFFSGVGGSFYNIFRDPFVAGGIIKRAPEIPASVAALMANAFFAFLAFSGFFLEFMNQRFKGLLADTSSSLSGALTHNIGEPRDEKTLFTEIRELKTSAQLIRNEIEGRRHTLRILLFGRLLAYAPVIVAKTEKYFEDLGIDVIFEYQSHGETDRNVAQGILDGRAEIGVCDPVAALSPRWEAGHGDNALKIVAPITKQLGATVLVDRSLTNGSGCKIAPTAAAVPNRKLRIAAYAKPSTSFTLARHLEEELHTLFPDHDVEIKQVAISDVRSFSTEVQDCHFVISWQPHTEYLLGSPTGSPSYEVLTQAHLGREVSENCAWIAEGPQSMGSAMVAKKSWVDENPYILKRVLVAIMLASMRLEALTARGARPDNSLAKNIHAELFSADDGADLDLVRGSLNRTLRHEEIGRTSLFPFFRGTTSMDIRDKYLQHLMNVIRFWKIEDVYSGEAGQLPANSLKEFFSN